MTFDSFSFDQRIGAGIADCGFTTPTPIQTKAIPEVLKGCDVMGLARTGTGKTAAFALPILQKLVRDGSPKNGPVRTLVLAPTRELAEQIRQSFIDLGRRTGQRCAAVFGGVGFGPQIKAARNSSIVVACPGRLVALLRDGSISLDQVDTLVLDEADRMLDMGFMPDIKRILSRLPAKRQNLLFSATMPSDIRKLAERILHRPVTVQVEASAPASSVSHAIYPVQNHLKAGLLDKLLADIDHESVLIFTRTKHRAKNLARQLGNKGHSATFLQGNMSQNQRRRALDGFQKGTFRIMVATDIVARGIDCERISHVINFDAPDTAETYTHRIGRTGRAGRSGSALSLVTRDDADVFRAVERLTKSRIDRYTLDDFDYEQSRPAGRGNNQPRANNQQRPGNGRKRPNNGRRNRRSGRAAA